MSEATVEVMAPRFREAWEATPTGIYNSEKWLSAHEVDALLEGTAEPVSLQTEVHSISDDDGTSCAQRGASWSA